MPVPKTPIRESLPRLRRYARALVGSPVAADQLVIAFLENLADARWPYPTLAARAEVFALFERTLPPAILQTEQSFAGCDFERALQRLPEIERKALLLIELEGFDAAEVAAILDRDEAEVEADRGRAVAALERMLAGRVLIIEDSYVQARQLAEIATEAGLTVIGMAANVRDAVALAEKTRPSLIISDLRLENGDSGFEAVRKLRSAGDIPAIFVTGYPELIEGTGLPPRSQQLSKPVERDELVDLIARKREGIFEQALQRDAGI